MTSVYIVCTVFVAMGIVFLCGKGGFLIAGYNTAGKKEKEQYDEKRLNKCFAVFCFGIALIIGLCGYFNTDAFALYVGLPVIVVLVASVLILSDLYCKKHK